MSYETLFTRSGSAYLDPDGCGSTVGYRIHVEKYVSNTTGKMSHNLSASVDLADCTHKIEWVFESDGGIEKVDVAIKMLQEFRKVLLRATTCYGKLES